MCWTDVRTLFLFGSFGCSLKGVCVTPHQHLLWKESKKILSPIFFQTKFFYERLILITAKPTMSAGSDPLIDKLDGACHRYTAYQAYNNILHFSPSWKTISHSKNNSKINEIQSCLSSDSDTFFKGVETVYYC